MANQIAPTPGGCVPQRTAPGVAVLLAFVLIGSGCAAAGAQSPCPSELVAAPALPTHEAGPRATYVFLIDRAFSPSDRRGRSYPWPALPMAARELTAKVLRGLPLRAGDAVFGAWISSRSADPSEIFLELATVPEAPAPDYPALLDRPTAPANPLGCAQYRQAERDYNLAAPAQAREIATLRDAWIVRQSELGRAFAEAAAERVSAAPLSADGRGTDVVGALAVAGRIIRLGAAQRSHVVLFTDLTDSVGRQLRPDLGGARVTIALYHRDDPADAEEGERSWKGVLQEFNAGEVTVLPWAGTTEARLLGLLRAGAPK